MATKEKATKAEKKRMTKSDIVSEVAEKSGLAKKQIGEIFEVLSTIIKRELSLKGPGEFVFPDIVKLKVQKRLAQKGKTFRNPQTGETIVRDVPASRRLRASVPKKLKDVVA